jgi:hypothetical protein
MQEQTNGYQQNKVQLLPGLRQSGQDLRWRLSAVLARKQQRTDVSRRCEVAYLGGDRGALEALLSVASCSDDKEKKGETAMTLLYWFVLVHRSVSI